MNTKIIWAVLAVIILAVIGWYAFGPNTASAPIETGTETPQAADETSETTTATIITYTDAGFSPSSVTIAVGDTVRFVNQSSGALWVGSNDHPTHTQYDGTTTREHCADGKATNGTFDQCNRGEAGTSWEYTFQKAGTFGYHNHSGASHTGTVVVE